MSKGRPKRTEPAQRIGCDYRVATVGRLDSFLEITGQQQTTFLNNLLESELDRFDQYMRINCPDGVYRSSDEIPIIEETSTGRPVYPFSYRYSIGMKETVSVERVDTYMMKWLSDYTDRINRDGDMTEGCFLSTVIAWIKSCLENQPDMIPDDLK